MRRRYSSRYNDRYSQWPEYVPVAERQAKARREMEKLRKAGTNIMPVELNGKTIARTFWGKGWCDHLESFSDYENRLPRGRTYVRNGSVCHLDIKAGRIEAMVCGTSLYQVTIEIKPLSRQTWQAVKKGCSGQIGTMLELLQGKFSENVMRVVADRKNGLFPQPGEMKLKCSCPDWATMCKHVAAALYGVGSRFDTAPELLFILRGVDAEELLSAEVALPIAPGKEAADSLEESGLEALFGIEMDSTQVATSAPKTKPAAIAAKKPPKKKTAKMSSKMIFIPTAPTGKAIAQLRKKAKMAETEFARQLGVSAASVKRWEAIPGRIRLQTSTIEALATMQAELMSKPA